MLGFLCTVTGFGAEQFEGFVKVIAVAVHRHADGLRALLVQADRRAELVRCRVAVKGSRTHHFEFGERFEVVRRGLSPSTARAHRGSRRP